jgi:hypothetical protein
MPSVIKPKHFRSGCNQSVSMKHFTSVIALLTLLFLNACKSDDTGGCVTCSAPQTLDFVLCEEDDGNASVNGENTGIRYDIYLQDLVADGANCGS